MLTKPYFARIFFDPNKGNEGGGSATSATAAEQDGKESKDAQSGGKQDGEGFKPITSEAELSAWKSSVRNAIAADIKKQFDDEQRKRDEDAKAKAEQDEAVKRGEFDKVKASIEEQRDAAKSEADSLKSRVEQYEALMARQLAARKVELKLPEEIMKRFPADADVLTQLEWLEEKAADIAIIRAEHGGPANGIIHPKTPLPNGVTKTEYEKAAEQMRGRIKI